MKRVFNIDQECFVIFLEDFTKDIDRFVRIGNSKFLKIFGDNLTFVDLITPLLPGDPFLELEIFRPDVDKIIIGLKKDVSEYINYLNMNKINTENLKIVYAEEQSKIVVTKKTEEDFIKEIENDTRIKNHSFASFYSDGNIRLFDRSNLIFDLKESLANCIDEYKEINNLSVLYENIYKNSYKKSGIIHSNNSLFIFSKNKFVCIAGNQNWIKDALRVGINPLKIDILYISDDIFPDSITYKIFSAKSQNQKKSKTNIIFRKEELTWDYLFPNKVFSPLYCDKNNINLNLPDIKISFKNDNIKITYKEIDLNFNYSYNFLNKGYIIDGIYNINNKKKDFKLLIEEIDIDSFTLYSYSPLIFEKNLMKKNYIEEFWNKIDEKSKKDFNDYIYKSDKKYIKDFELKIDDKDNFYSKLFTETVRRINIEGNSNINNDIFNQYKNILNDFKGELINSNKIIFEQYFGKIDGQSIIGIRDVLISSKFTYLKKEINPFLIFQKEFENQDWEEKQKEYRDSYKKNIEDQNDLRKITNRFIEVTSNKRFFKEEQERLLRFINKIITQESGKGIIGSYQSKESKEKLNKIINEKLNYKTDKDNKTIFEESTTGLKNKKYKKGNKLLKLIALLAILLGIMGLGLISYFFTPIGPFIKDKLKLNKNDVVINNGNNNNHINQDDAIKKLNEEFNSDNANLKSKHYKFFITILDVYYLTNIIAEKNGYHKIVYNHQKAYVKGKDPDWIYPNNELIMPNDSKILIKEGNTMWGISEKYIIDQINKHEEEILKTIENTKRNIITIDEAKEELRKIRKESHSEIVKKFLTILIKLDSFKGWEPYIEEMEIKEENKK